MKHLEVSGAVRPLKLSLGVKWLSLLCKFYALLTLELRIEYNEAEERSNNQEEPDSSIVWACLLILILPWLGA